MVRDGLNSFNGAVRFVRKREEGGRESAKRRETNETRGNRNKMRISEGKREKESLYIIAHRHGLYKRN